MPYPTLSFRRRMMRREVIGEIAALLGTTLLLLLMMTQPDWNEPAFHIAWGATGLALVLAGAFLMLSGRGQADRRRPGAAKE